MSESKKLPFSFAMNINTQDETGAEAAQVQPDKSFCIAMMGNFSARQDITGNDRIGDRTFIQIDRYNYDEVLASMGLELSLELDQDSNSSVDLAIRSLKDFHPDSLYKNVAVFGELRDLRDRLNNPETFQQAMQQLGIEEDDASLKQDSQTAEESPAQITAAAPLPEPGASLLDSIMQETQGRSSQNAEPSASQTAKSLVDGLVQQVVAKTFRTMSRDARQDELVASIDETITLKMRALLHHPRFQALEAAWRALHFMVKRIRSGKEVKLYLLDLSRDELASDLAIDDVTQTQLYRQFCDTAAGDIDWNLIIGDYRFGPDIDDMLLLSQLGIIAQQAGAQFMAGADEKLVGCSSFADTPKADSWAYEIDPQVQEAWGILRQSAVAKNISLALPRFMLRAPYGSKSSPLKAFAFEEMSEPPEHAAYLWGNPAFLKAEQTARAFLQSGWNMNYAKVLNTEDLPLHYYQQGGQTIVQPCAEISLTDTGASKMLAQGLIPLWSVKNSDRVHSGDFHSIAE